MTGSNLSFRSPGEFGDLQKRFVYGPLDFNLIYSLHDQDVHVDKFE